MHFFSKFVICGILSIYTEVHPSKKLVRTLRFLVVFYTTSVQSLSMSCYMNSLNLVVLFLCLFQVTASLAMYIVSLFGIMVSFGSRVHYITFLAYRRNWGGYHQSHNYIYRVVSLKSTHTKMLTCNL